MSTPEQNVKVKDIIAYIGDDATYWDTITGRIKRSYPDLKIDFVQIYQADPAKYLSCFEKIARVEPKIVYIDFSLNTKSQMKLAQMIKRENMTSKAVLVGLVDSKKMLLECIFAGMTFTHIKCGEYHDVVYDPFKIAYPKVAKCQDFAKAVFRTSPPKGHVYEDFRIGYVTPKGIHVESNLKFQKGDLIELEVNIPERIVPSNKYIVSEVSDQNLYYDYTYAYDLDFIFVDPPEIPEAEGDAVLDPKKLEKMKAQVEAEYKNEILITRKKVKQWVVDNMDSNHAKDTRILLIDNTMDSLLTASKPLDQYPFVIRFQRALTLQLREIDNLKPNLIVLQFDAASGDEIKVEEKKKDNSAAIGAPARAKVDPNAVLKLPPIELLGEIIKKVSSMDKYKPFILVYGSKFTSQGLKEKFSYDFLLANTTDLNIDQMAAFADAYEKKQKKKFDEAITAKIKMLRSQNPIKYKSLKVSDFVPERYYIKKTSEISHISFGYEVEILSMTESELTISTTADLNLGVYRFDTPFMLAITLIPVEEGKKNIKNGLKYEYKALFHSIDDEEKKKLRVFINDNFLETVRKQRAQEATDFKQKNQDVQKTKEGGEGN